MPEPAPLDWLLKRLTLLIQTATGSLADTFPDGVDAWEAEVSRQLARYHGAAMLAGSGAAALTPAMRTKVTSDLASQLDYLAKFGLVIQGASEFQAGWQARAAMYARSITVPYWRGATKMLPLPAMPAEGTDCLTNCKCQWEVSALNGDGNYDAYWRRSADDSCATCRQRELSWSPVKIRGGELQV